MTRHLSHHGLRHGVRFRTSLRWHFVAKFRKFLSHPNHQPEICSSRTNGRRLFAPCATSRIKTVSAPVRSRKAAPAPATAAAPVFQTRPPAWTAHRRQGSTAVPTRPRPSNSTARTIRATVTAFLRHAAFSPASRSSIKVRAPWQPRVPATTHANSSAGIPSRSRNDRQPVAG